MPKVLLAEDDANLREIFEMRLRAEGFEVITAGDGEEALVVATREKPDLLVVDIMMPKISGFEMLETLRANPETSSIKAIAMTALGQAEDRQRGERLGVIKYLVKSQVTLEDFVRAVHEALDTNKSNNQQRSNMDPTNQPPVNPSPADGTVPATPPAEPPVTPVVPTDGMSTADERAVVDEQVDKFAASATPPEPVMPPVAPATPPAEPPQDPTSQQPAFGASGDTPATPATPGETVEPTVPTNEQV